MNTLSQTPIASPPPTHTCPCSDKGYALLDGTPGLCCDGYSNFGYRPTETCKTGYASSPWLFQKACGSELAGKIGRRGWPADDKFRPTDLDTLYVEQGPSFLFASNVLTFFLFHLISALSFPPSRLKADSEHQCDIRGTGPSCQLFHQCDLEAQGHFSFFIESRP